MAIRKRIKKKVLQALEKRFMRYLVAAGVATVVDILVYTLVYGMWLTEHVYFSLTPDVHITGQLLSILVSYHCGLVVNFAISKYYVFKESSLQTSTQFVRFWMVAEIVFVANYLMTRYLWELTPYLLGMGDLDAVAMWGIDNRTLLAFINRTISAGSIGVLSFVLHKVFSFEVQLAVEQAAEDGDDNGDYEEDEGNTPS